MTNIPVTGIFTVTAAYGETGKYWATFHKGVDIVCENKKIYCTCDGVVKVVAYDKNGWGNYVSVHDSEGFRHIFCHLANNSVKVKVGDKVTRATIIGTMGATGNASGVHLHYQINNKNNQPINPCPYMGIPNKRGTYDSKDYEVNKVDYKDEANISNYAKEGVNELTKLGILNGFPDGKFHPKSNLTREEYAASLWRLYEKIKRN